eukprot:Rmarinus@m.27937
MFLPVLLLFAGLACSAAAPLDWPNEGKSHDMSQRSYLGRLNSDGSWDQTVALESRLFMDMIQEEAVLTVSPEVLQKSGDSVSISWSHVDGAASNDWIAIYMEPYSKDQDYLDYIWANGEPSGEVTVPITNLRADLHFRYFQYVGDDAYGKVTVSNTLRFADNNEPLQGHLALTGNPTEMTVSFTSASWDTPVVQYGSHAEGLDAEAAGTSTTYSAEMMCGLPAIVKGPRNFIDPGVMHTVTLTKLSPGQRYYYRYGHPTTGSWSDVHSFVAARQPADHSEPVRILAYGDMGHPDYPGSFTTSDRLALEIDDTDFLLHFGDLSYALGRGYQWDTWMEIIQPTARQIPYMVSVGNHEYCHTAGGVNDPSGAEGNGFHPEWGNYGNDSGGECSVPVFHRFASPTNGHGVYWYSFDYAGVHVIQMSTEHDFLPGSVQYQWMEEDLASVDREVTPFIVFTGHRPMYNCEMYASDFKVANHIREAFENLLVEHGVDVALWGHYHSYQRTCRVNDNKCSMDDDPDGVVHITIGAAGAHLDGVDLYPVEWEKYTEYTFGIVRVIADPIQGDLLVEFVRNDDGEVRDFVRLAKRHGNSRSAVVVDEMH